jgi:hypothetical protein
MFKYHLDGFRLQSVNILLHYKAINVSLITSLHRHNHQLQGKVPTRNPLVFKDVSLRYLISFHW